MRDHLSVITAHAQVMNIINMCYNGRGGLVHLVHRTCDMCGRILSSPGAARNDASVRKMKCELGVVSRADGSARMLHGDTAGRAALRCIAVYDSGLCEEVIVPCTYIVVIALPPPPSDLWSVWPSGGACSQGAV